MGYIKKLKNNELVGGTDKTTIYPVTSTEAVFEEITNGNESSFKSQKTINKEQQDELDAHNGRVTYLEDHAVKSVTINGGTKTYTVDDAGNVDLTIYTVNPDDPDVPAMATLVEKNRDDIADIKEEIGTDTTESTLSGRIKNLETTVGTGGSVDQRIENAVNALDANIEGETGDENVQISLTQEDGKVTSLELSGAASSNDLTELYNYTHGLSDGIIVVTDHTQVLTPDTTKVYREAGTDTYTDWMYSNGWNKLATYAIDNLDAQVSYYRCETPAATAAKVVNATYNPDHPHLEEYVKTIGGHIKVWMKFTNTSNDTVTLKIGNSEASELLYNGEAISASNTWDAEEVLAIYYYDGKYWASNVQGGNKKDTIDNEYVVAKALSEHDRKLNLHDRTLSAQETAIGIEASRNNNQDDLIEELQNRQFVGEDEEFTIAKAFNYLNKQINSGGGANQIVGEVTTSNSDCITIYGSSYGISSYATTGKHAIDIMNMFSDYKWQNISQDGSSKLTQLQAIRGETSRFKPVGKYVILYNNENNGDLNHTDAIKATELFAKTMRSFGAEPIIGTGYNSGDARTSLYRDYCHKNNYLFANSQSYYKIIQPSKTGQNTHLNTRQLPVVAYTYMDCLHCLERPTQSLKFYRLRTFIIVNSLDELLFNDNIERAKKFKIANFGSVSVNYALVSCVLPATEKNLSSVLLKLTTSDTVKVYVRNTLASPYPQLTTYTRFLVNDETTVPSQGSVYSFNGTNYTVASVITENPYSGYCDIYCLPKGGSLTGSGVIQKVSGEGPASINIAGAEPEGALSQKLAVNSDTNGHWEEIESTNHDYLVVGLDGKVDFDTVHFLIYSETTPFTISNASVTYKASALKTCYHRQPQIEFDSNYYSDKTEIIPQPTFGAIGTTTSWKDDNNTALVSVKTSTEACPVGCSSVLNLSDTVSANIIVPTQSLTKEGKAFLEVWCRYSGFDANNTDLVTTESWDFNELSVGMGNPSTTGYAEFKEQIGLAWKICRYEIDIFPSNYSQTAIRIRLSAERYGMEIAKVSLKYKN